MTATVPAAGILDYFRDGFARTAWRLEAQHGYAADQTTEDYRRFLQGHRPPRDDGSPWFANVREQTTAGKRIERVRLVDTPPTDNQRYLLATIPDNLDAGEDIRYLFRSDAQRIGLPEDDFWLFDSRVLARFNWADPARRLELTTDSEQVAAACQIRDTAWLHAVAYREFLARVPSLVWPPTSSKPG